MQSTEKTYAHNVQCTHNKVHIILTKRSHFNPLLPNGTISSRSAKILILILEGIIKKISYERRDYESVDEKSLS